MRLISCSECGTVMDTDRIVEPDYVKEDGEINRNIAIWRNRDYEAAITCPSCKSKICYSDGEAE